jgi:peptidoglycan hydrolase-like protein with peptidoglycan-binding domain
VHRWDLNRLLRLAAAGGAVLVMTLGSTAGTAFASAGTPVAVVRAAPAAASGDVTCTRLPYASSTIRRGSRGSLVRDWQHRLNVAVNARLVVDGIFGPRTERATRTFQSARHLVPDGVVGRRTQAAMARLVIAGQLRDVVTSARGVYVRFNPAEGVITGPEECGFILQTSSATSLSPVAANVRIDLSQQPAGSTLPPRPTLRQFIALWRSHRLPGVLFELHWTGTGRVIGIMFIYAP